MRSTKNPDSNETISTLTFIIGLAALPLHLITFILVYMEYLALGRAREYFSDSDKFIATLISEAKLSKNGVAIARLGAVVPYLHLNMAVVIPGANQPATEETTKRYRDLLAAFEEQRGGRGHVGVLSSIARPDGGHTIADSTLAEGAMETRKAIIPFSSDVNGFLKISRPAFNRVLEDWATKQDGIILANEMKTFIHDLVAERFFGAKLTPEEHAMLLRSIADVRKAILDLNPFSKGATIQAARETYSLFARQIVDARRERILSAVNDSENKNRNIFAEMIRRKIGEDKHLTPQAFLHDPYVNSSVLMATIADGVYANTTALLLQLAVNKPIQAKLMEELRGHCNEQGDIPDDILKSSTSLPYLDAVIKEGLRHASTVAILGRHTVNGIHTDHVQLPPQTLTLINLYAMHHSEAAWGPDAKEFNPERFLNSEMSRQYPIGQVPFMPFSMGSRQCTGTRVALIEMRYLISAVLLGYDIVPVPGQAAPVTSDERPIGSDPGENYRVIIRRRSSVENAAYSAPVMSADAALAAAPAAFQGFRSG